MHVALDFYRDQRYRVFAHQGNILSEDGVTVSVNLIEEDWDGLEFKFFTREDAVTFFRNLALAAEITTFTEEDELEPGHGFMLEAVTGPRDALAEVLGPRAEGGSSVPGGGA